MKRGPDDGDSQRKRNRPDSQTVSAEAEPKENQSLFANIINAISSWFFTRVEQPSAQIVSDILKYAEIAEIKAWIAEKKRLDSDEPILCTAGLFGREDVMRWILQNGHTDTVRLLLELPEGQRPDVNVRDRCGMTPLHCSATHFVQTTETARLLLNLLEEQRPDVNARDNVGMTSLHLAACDGRTDMVRLLLELPEGQRPDVNLINNEGKTPIECAFEQGRHDIVTLLQQHGAQLPAHYFDVPPDAAAAINDGQSVHTTSNHESVSNSATALLQCYVTEDVTAARDSLFAWVRAQSGDINNMTDKTEAAKRCIENYGARNYTRSRSFFGVTRDSMPPSHRP